MFLATTAAAGPPCAGESCTATGACTTLGECDSGCTSFGNCQCGCQAGYPCKCGPGCGCGQHGGGRWWQFGRGDDNGLVGAEQKCHNGKLWPPYPRPQENGSCCTQFHANHYWPHPYNCWDRAWTQQLLAQQTANGWERATTLCAFHFDPETHCLNDSGLLHLRWILEHAPGPYRTIYVQSADDGGISATRQASVESESMAISGSRTAPVIVRPVQLAGRPANEVDTIRRAEIRTMPTPRVVIDSVGTGSGDGM